LRFLSLLKSFLLEANQTFQQPSQVLGFFQALLYVLKERLEHLRLSISLQKSFP
jgi:hypothetical protein